MQMILNDYPYHKKLSIHRCLNALIHGAMLSSELKNMNEGLKQALSKSEGRTTLLSNELLYQVSSLSQQYKMGSSDENLCGRKFSENKKGIRKYLLGPGITRWPKGVFTG